MIVVKYATKRRAFTYLGILQSVTEEDKCHIQYLTRSGGKTFSLKEGDRDIVDVNNIFAILTNFSVNSRGQYIVDTILLWTCEGITKHILFNQTFCKNIFSFLKCLVSTEMKTVFFNRNVDLFIVH